MRPTELWLTREPFHIEHPRRGVLKDRDGDNDQDGFRFSWSGHRAEVGKCWRFQSLGYASVIYWQLPERIRKDCKIIYWDAKDESYSGPFRAVSPIPHELIRGGSRGR